MKLSSIVAIASDPLGDAKSVESAISACLNRVRSLTTKTPYKHYHVATLAELKRALKYATTTVKEIKYDLSKPVTTKSL